MFKKYQIKSILIICNLLYLYIRMSLAMNIIMCRFETINFVLDIIDLIKLYNLCGLKGSFYDVQNHLLHIFIYLNYSENEAQGKWLTRSK